MSDFAPLGLAEPLLRALTDAGYTTPTPIQAQAIPALIEGHDLLGIAQTGTGKTAAFTLPMLQKLEMTKGRLPRRAIRALVLAPTRELASQIEESIRDYGKYYRLQSRTAFGGVPIHRQIAALANGLDILVATPGRLLDLIERDAVFFDFVEFLVVDEADQMMDMGFIEPLRKLVAMLPKQRQTLFFSATMPKEIRSLADSMLKNPIEVRVAPSATPAEKVKQSVIHIDHSRKAALLRQMLDETALTRVIVFARTKHGADRVVKTLERMGVPSAAIHGNRSQPQRERALDGFRRGAIRLLIATDIAARGIDIDNVSHVINYDLPNVPETYVHRIGRTARAGADGEAVSFCSPDERNYLRQIERTIRRKLDVIENPLGNKSAAEIAAERNDQPLRPEETLDGQDKAERAARTKTREGRSRKEGGSHFGGNRVERDAGPRRERDAGPRRERDIGPRRERDIGAQRRERFEGERRSPSRFEREEAAMDGQTEAHIAALVSGATGEDVKAMPARKPRLDRPQGDRPGFNRNSRPAARGHDERPARDFGDRPARSNRNERPAPAARAHDERPARSERQQQGWSPVESGARTENTRPARDFGDRPARFKRDERPAHPARGENPRPARGPDDRPARDFGDRPARAERPFSDRPRSDDRRGKSFDKGHEGSKGGTFNNRFGKKKTKAPAGANRGRFMP